MADKTIGGCVRTPFAGPPCRQHSRGQVANSRPEPESIYPGTAGAIPEACNVRPHEPHTPMPQAPREESSDSTHFSAKRQRDRKSQLSNSMHTRLGLQEPGRPRPPAATTWAARPDPVVTPMAGRNLPNEPPISSISKRLDDMLSTPFYSHIIHYEPPRGFLGVREVVRSSRASSRGLQYDVVLQIFKRSICPGTPFFESLAKKPPTMMDDLFRRANKYSMLEDDVRAATQQVLVAGQASRGGAERNAKLPDRPRPSDRRQEGPSRPERPPLTPLSISYEKLLPMIQGLSDFKWPRPIGTDPSTRDHSKRYAEGRGASQHHNSGAPRTPAAPRAPAAPKVVINYINGGSSDEEYDSRRKRQKLLRAASISERINSIRLGLTGGGPRPIDGTIIFPPVDPTLTLQPHRDALILSLEIGDFDVRCILVDPGSSADLVQASVVSHMGHSLTSLENPGESCPNSMGHQPLPWETFYYRSKLAQSLSTQLAARQYYQIARESGTSQEDASSLSPAIRMTNSNYWVRWTKIPRQQIPYKRSKFRRRNSPYEYQFSPRTEETQKMQSALRQNYDIFAWTHSDMKGIDPSITSHKLNILQQPDPSGRRVYGQPKGIEVSLDQVKAVIETPPPRKKGVTTPHSLIPKENYTCIWLYRSGQSALFYSAVPHPRSRNLSTISRALADVETDLTGRMLQWAIELSEFGIEFQPRLSMKGQVMADFVLEYSRKPSQRQESSEKEWWTLRVDGASRSSGSGVGLLLQSQQGNTWSKPSSWDSLPPTMKQNMRPSYPDWTSFWLYPSPSSGL
ncbi:hypothetical protein CK203_034646 [Vitis vinifera]|uniref:Uncharacterized protein n=1 Tax=Vitis vinifera TaxID=29760 RepID=A0A438HWH7_VITVI|nr:hypothetical protein CK203_034646 [Vitis vinifera]